MKMLGIEMANHSIYLLSYPQHIVIDSLLLRLEKLEVVVSDEDAWNRNGKPFNLSSLIPSPYCHYYHILLIPSQELTLPWKPVA